MNSGKLITGIAIGTITALILIPKTRQMLYTAMCNLTDSLKGIADDAAAAVNNGSNELDKLSGKVTDVADTIRETKQVWQ